MDKKLEIKDFDILGIISLQDVEGIEKYVTPVIRNGKRKEYLSRSKEYYNVKTMTELALERENFKRYLTKEYNKRNFVILENMLNCSGKVYFKKFEEYILTNQSECCLEELQSAQACMEEDMSNIINILQGQGEIKLDRGRVLPVGDENSTKRSIEMDNKAMLYLFAKTLKIKKDPRDIEVLTPGYGSIYIGPMLKAMYGYNYSTLLKSKYIEETMHSQKLSLESLLSSHRALNPEKTILILDDNIGTGATMTEIKDKLQEKGIKNFISGAVQYNWRNYYRVSIGEKKDIDRFETDDFDILSPLNFAGHKLYKHAIDLLHSSGAEYIDYLQSKSYRKEEISDIEGALYRGVLCARATGLELDKDLNIPMISNSYQEVELLEKYKDGPKELSNPISKQIIKNLSKEIKEASMQQDIDDDEPKL